MRLNVTGREAVMGAYLSQPITDKESSDGEDAKFKYGTTAMQGWRTNMEVSHGGTPPLAFICVFVPEPSTPNP